MQDNDRDAAPRVPRAPAITREGVEMLIKWPCACLLLGLVMAVLLVQPATAAVCGTTDPDTGKVARANLSLGTESKTESSFKRDDKPEPIYLEFKVTGCDLTAQLVEPPSYDILPRRDAELLPADAISLQGEPNYDDSTSVLSMRFNVDPAKFDPGSYGAIIEVRAPYLVTSRTPISVSRSDRRYAILIAIGAAAGLMGFAWYLALQGASGKKLKVSRPLVAVVGISAAVAGILAALVFWQSQDVWVFADNWLATATAAFTGATTGTMLGLLGAIFREERRAPEA